MTWVGLKSNFCNYLIVFIFRCMNALALLLPPSISSIEPFLIKGLLCRGEGVLKEQMKINRGRGGVRPISMLTLWKIVWFFKQQIEFLLISCLAVAKSFKRRRHFHNFFYISTCKYFYYCYHRYISVLKTLPYFMLSLQKNNYFLPFHPTIFHSKIHKHPACKMNRDKLGERRLKIRSFEWTYFSNEPKVFLLQLRSIFYSSV